MKYRDPTIRACHGAPKPITIKRPAPPAPAPEPKVYRVNTPVPFVAREMPSLDRLDFLPGGLPPKPYRTPWGRVGLTGKGAREPFNSRDVRREYWATKRYLEG